MDEFVMRKKKKVVNEAERYKSVNIWPKTFEQLSKLREQTGYGMGYIISQMADFCIERLKLVPWEVKK